MKSYATQAEQDAAREEWFATRFQRQREHELRQHRKAQQEDFLREWWGLPEADPERRRRELEKLRRGERVGGFPAQRIGASDTDSSSPKPDPLATVDRKSEKGGSGTG